MRLLSVGVFVFLLLPGLAESRAQAQTAPRGSQNRWDLHFHASHAVELLDNLIANPSVRDEAFKDVELHCKVLSSGAADLALLDTCIAKAAQIKMPIYPAIRVFHDQLFPSWVDVQHWTSVAADIEILAAKRASGDPRIGLDAEPYAAGTLPTVQSLTSNGYNVAQLRSAMEPFLAKLLQHNVVVCVYPQATYGVELDPDQFVNQFIVALLDRLGPERVQIWWYDSFDVAEEKRQDPHVGFHRRITKLRRGEAAFERACGKLGLNHRHAVNDDLLRVWGAPMRADLDTLGSIRPWVFDFTRIDYPQYGTPEFVAGTSVKVTTAAPTVNDMQYVWSFGPLEQSNILSVGIAPAPQVLGVYHGDAGSIVPGSSSGIHALGVEIAPDPPVFPVAAMRANEALPPGAWTIDFTFRIPQSLAQDGPILSEAQYNYARWQVDYSHASDKIMLRVVRPDDTIATYEVMSSVPRDVDIRLQLGRDGMSWLYGVQDGPVHLVDVGFQTLPTNKILMVGAGLAPSTFPQTGAQACCPGLLLRGQLSVWHRLLSQDEIVTSVRSGQYPWGRGKGLGQ